MILIESVNSCGTTFRTAIRRTCTMTPVMRLRASLEARHHRNIKVMTEDGVVLTDIGFAVSFGYEHDTVRVVATPKLRAVQAA